MRNKILPVKFLIILIFLSETNIEDDGPLAPKFNILNFLI